MISKLYGMIVLATLTVLLIATTSRAVIVTQSSAGLLIADGFDSDTPGSVPAGWSNTSTVGRPTIVPTVESVSYNTANSITPSPSSANQPPNFVNLDGNEQSIYQLFSNSYTTGTITATFAFYISSDPDSNIFPEFMNGSNPTHQGETFIGLVNPDWVANELGLATPSGGEVAYYPGGMGAVYHILTAASVPYVFGVNQWHDASFSYDIAAGGATTAMTITIDGTTLDPLPVTNNSAQSLVTGFEFYDNGARGGGSSFIDGIPGDVPEPASLGLIVLGGAALLRRRRA